MLSYLAASPHLRGEPFEGSVILLLEHSAQGAVGLIVNAPLPHTVAEVVDTEGPLPRAGEHAWYGGPVDARGGWCVYAGPLGLDGEIRLGERLCVSSSLEVLHAALAAGPAMLLLGYAGWGPGQLEEEIRGGSWLWVEAGEDLVLDTPARERWAAAIGTLDVDPSTLVPGSAEA